MTESKKDFDVIKVNRRPTAHAYAWKDSVVSNDDFILIGNESNFLLLPIKKMRSFDRPTRFTADQAAAIVKYINNKELKFFAEDADPIPVTFAVLNALYELGDIY